MKKAPSLLRFPLERLTDTLRNYVPAVSKHTQALAVMGTVMSALNEQAYNERRKSGIRKNRQESEKLQRIINCLSCLLEQTCGGMCELELQHPQDNLAKLYED